MSPCGVCPPPSVDPYLVPLNPVNLIQQCPKPQTCRLWLCALPDALCCHCPCQLPHRPAPENNPLVMLLSCRLPAWFSFPYLFCSTLLHFCYTNRIAAYCRKYILCLLCLHSPGGKLHISASHRRPVGATRSIQILIFKY
jgi:hypothetical protein